MNRTTETNTHVPFILGTTEISNLIPENFEEFKTNLEKLNDGNLIHSLEKVNRYTGYLLNYFKEEDKRRSFKPYFDRAMILEFCEQLPNARDKAILLSVFEGIYGKQSDEILQIRPEDVKENGIYLRARSAVFPASKELVSFYQEAMKETESRLISKNGIGKSVPLYLTDSALKTMDSSGELNGRMFAIRFMRIFEFLGFRKLPTISDIRDCGQIYYFTELAQNQGISISELMNKGDTGPFVDRFNFQSFTKNNLVVKFKERNIHY